MQAPPRTDGRSPAPPAPPLRRRAVAPWIVAVGVPTLALAAHMALFGRWIVDDAGITFAYARSLATGAGPVLQPGAEVVEGYSNPAWLGLLVLGRLLGLFDHGTWFGTADQVLFPKLLALACGAGVVAMVHTVSRELSSSPWRAAGRTVAVGVLAAAVPSYAIWMSSGLENPLLALSAVGIAAVLARAVLRGRLDAPAVAVTCGLLAALAALTRPDGLTYAAAYPVVALVLLRRDGLAAAARSTALSLVAFAVPFGAYLGWRVATFGHWLPNTAVAKSQGLPDAAALARPGELLSVAGWPTAVLALALIGAAMLRPGRDRRVLVALLVPLGLAVAAYLVLAPDWMGQQRFATPVWPLAALAAVTAAGRVLPELTRRARAAVAVAAAAAVLVSGVSWLAATEKFRAGPTVPMCAIAQGMGVSPNAFGDILGIRDGRIATPDIGGTALASRYEVIDIVGLASAPIARYWRAGDLAGLRSHLLDDVRPEFVEIHGNWSTSTGLLADPRMRAGYEPILMTGPQSGWFVRRDAVPDPARLEQVRAYARDVALPLRVYYGNAGRAGCGPVQAGATTLVSPAAAPSPR